MSISVTAGNSAYSSAGGILYNKDKTVLMLCPEGKTGTVNIPGTVTGIESIAFYACTGLTGVTIGNSVTVIGKSAFWDCTGLTVITIPNSVTRIEEGAFYGCTSLASVTFEGRIPSSGFPSRSASSARTPAPPPPAFPGDLVAKYLAANGGPGTYTRTPPIGPWTKR
jgi:hypothetical protein